jgi:MSHA biogenesis protein MshL
VDVRDSRGGLPGVSDLLRNTARGVKKKELVILLKPTLLRSERDWETDVRESRERFQGFAQPVAPPR